MTEKNFLTKTLTDTILSRRSFLKWSAALGGTAALAGGLNHGLKAVSAATQSVESEGEWKPFPCWQVGCGGYCVNFGLVKDGVVIRQKTDDSHEDSPDYPTRKGCVRGRAQRTLIYSNDRLKYPMKRKNWEPGGGKKELRGRDEWVRISWEEALDLTAAEIKRIKETYGNAAIVQASRLLNAYGGAMEKWGCNSEGSNAIVRDKMAGTLPPEYFVLGGKLTGGPDRFSYRDSKLIVCWGENPAWSYGGAPMYNLQQAKKAGAKFIFVTPELNPSAVALEAEWIPVRPSTDTALLLGLAYHMITNNLQDQAFLDTYTVGFDAEHMPEGVSKKDNFKDYVLGTYDGVPKTPEWASEICGTDPDTIRSFAFEIATTKPMYFDMNGAPCRTHLGQQFGQAFFTVGWMTGNVGLHGGAVSHQGQKGWGGSNIMFYGGTGEPSIDNPLFPPVPGAYSGGYDFEAPFDTSFTGVAYDELWDAILNNEVSATVRGKIPCDIRMMNSIGQSNNLVTTGGGLKAIKAIRKLEFIVSCDINLSDKSKYADIVLPGTTGWEEFGYVKAVNDPENILLCKGIIEPLWETKSIEDIETELGKRLGLDPNIVHPLSAKQRFYNQIAGTIYLNTTTFGMEPLVTITKDDIKEWGVDGKPQQGIVTIKEIVDKGGYEMPRQPGDAYQMIADMPAQMFRADPVANPAKTESGKLEIYCKELVRYIDAYGFDKGVPIAKYTRPVEGIEDTYADWDKKIKGDYPLQMCNPHYIRRSHSTFNNVPWLRRAHPQDALMNTIDAEERGLQAGDTILVTSRHGKVLRRVNMTDFVIPG
ncbi:MAG: molybdopterin-dependent oxidoreductase, partial [Candidatus Atribacteria bacterium]|nr:molybdopterin-dependent oxidoreductase [Candidatus Atribacteria bacterium]